jgi:hypothetical protein
MLEVVGSQAIATTNRIVALASDPIPTGSASGQASTAANWGRFDWQARQCPAAHGEG